MMSSSRSLSVPRSDYESTKRLDKEAHTKRAPTPLRYQQHHHRHTNSLGLPSPNASASSLSLSPARTPLYPYHAPPTPLTHTHTPLRSASAASLASSLTGAPALGVPASSSPRARTAGITPHTHTPTPKTPAPAQHQRPLSPSTPRARASPFFRLLLPFAGSPRSDSAPSSPIPTPTPTPSTSTFVFNVSNTTTADNDSNMALHHPTPQHPQSPMAQRPTTPSRSERLLRDALQRDEKERNNLNNAQLPSSPLVSSYLPLPLPLPNSPSSSPSAQRPTHRRRHSHVPTSTTTRGMASPRMDKEPRVDEEHTYTRGSFLFRTPMSNPSPHGPEAPIPFYGGDTEAEGEVPSSPSRTHRHQQRYTPQRQEHQQQEQEQERQPTSSASRRPRSVQSQSQEQSDERSPSPSPMPTHRRRRPGSLQLQRPSPLVLDGVLEDAHHNVVAQGPGYGSPTQPRASSGSRQVQHQRQHDPHQRHQQREAQRIEESPNGARRRPAPISLAGPQGQGQEHTVPYAASGGEPLVETPQGQVLKARLERVLLTGRVVEPTEEDKRRRSTSGSRTSESTGRSASGSRTSWTNEVRDEEGGWPWRARERERVGPSGVSSPLNSSQSGSSGSGSSKPYPHPHPPHQHQQQSVQAHSRSRSQTYPVPSTTTTTTTPSASVGVGVAATPALTPRRGGTAPMLSTPTTTAASKKPGQMKHTGTTPPLVTSGSGPHSGAGSGECDEEGEGEDGDGELKLLTPPPTPPHQTRLFFSYISSARGGAGGGEGYCPSPYKTRHDLPRPSAYAIATTRRGPLHSALGNPRRPANAPVGGRYSSSGSQEQEHDQDQDQEEGSASSELTSSSSRSFPSSTYANADPLTAIPPLPLSPPAHPSHLNMPLPNATANGTTPIRPPFNARKASAQCRAIDGYVSFASVEGLGEPPADPMSPVDGPDGAEEQSGRGAAGVLAAAWGGGWRKLLGVVSSTGESNAAGQKENGVVV